MDYAFINPLLGFLEMETLNASNDSNSVPTEWTHLLEKMNYYGDIKDTKCIRYTLDAHTELIAIHGDRANGKTVQSAFIDKNFTKGIFLFTDYLRNKEIDVLINEETNPSIPSGFKENLTWFLSQWNLHIIEILNILGVDSSKFNPAGSVFERQLALLPVYLLTHMNTRINEYFKSLDPEEIFNRYRYNLHLFFPSSPMLDNEDHRRFSIKLSNIARDNNPLVNCI